MKSQRRPRFFTVSTFSIFVIISGLGGSRFTIPHLEAAGPKPPGPTEPVLRTPTPKRVIYWKGVRSPQFVLPNGQEFSISPELSQHLEAAIIQSGDYELILGPSETSSSDLFGAAGECDETVELRAHLSHFELEATQLKVRFGYTPSGNLWGGISQIHSKVEVALHSAIMDVVIAKCKQGVCKGIAAGTAKLNPATVNSQIQIDFSQIVLGIDFLYKTPLAQWLNDLFKAAMNDMKKYDQRLDVPWQAKVIAVHPSRGGLSMDAGSQSGIRLGDSFYIMREVTSNACRSFLPIAQAQVKGEITPVSSFLEWTAFTNLNASDSVQVGDTLMIKRVEEPK